MRFPFLLIVTLFASVALAACADYSSADWPDLVEGFEFSPTAPRAEPAVPKPPQSPLSEERIGQILADGRELFAIRKLDVAALFGDYEGAWGDFEALSGDAAGRAWLSAQLALSRVSQAADGLSLLRADLRRAEAQSGDKGAELLALMAEVEAHKETIDQRLIAERQRLNQRRPD